MNTARSRVNNHLGRVLAALLGVAIATGGPWQAALAEGAVLPADGNATAESVSLVAQDSGTPYYDPTDTTGNKHKSAPNCKVLSASGDPVTMGEGWWTLTRSVDYSQRVTVSGNVNLILTDTKTLTCRDGIFVPEGSSLTIWAQTDGDSKGKLIVGASELKAAIGAVEDEDAGAVTINGGYVQATGGDKSAGIGGAYNADPGPITINGGYVVAKGGYGAAGIGGGYGVDCNNDIRIEGATVEATGSYEGNWEDGTCAAGIGAGGGGDLECTVTITNATVTAKACASWVSNLDGFLGGAGIGAGGKGNASNGKVYITNSQVTAHGRNGAAGIGGGKEKYGVGGEGAGLVEIKGLTSVVVAEADGSSCSAIGHGNDDEFMGNLTIDPGLKVQAGNDGTNYERTFLYRTADGADERVGACNWHRSARIEACDHPGATFDSIDQSFHRQRDCAYCGTTFNNEAHNTDGDEGTCTVCGHKGDMYMLAFHGGGADGTMGPVYVAKGKSVELPGCGFDVPKGKTFAGWKIGTATYAAGDPYAPTADVIVTAQWLQELAPELKSHSLTLSGAIGVDYFMDLSSLDDATRQASRMEFTVGEGAKQTTHTVGFDAATKDSNGKGYFGFSCPTSSVQMADAISATFHWGDEVLELPDYSIKAYVEGFDAYQAAHVGKAGAFDAKTVALVHAIADYGHYAQIYLSGANGWVVGADYAEMDVFYTASYGSDLAGIKDALAKCALSKSYGDPIASAAMSLVLDSGTALDVILKPAGGGSLTEDDAAKVAAAFTDAKKPEPRLSGGNVSVRVGDVSAHQLATPLIVQYGGKQVLSLSALSYANAVVSGSDATKPDAARDAMCALYRYYEAAAALKA